MSNTSLKLSWVIVYVPDVQAALSLYETAFGLTRKFVTPDATYGELDTGGTTLAFAHDSLGDSNFDGGVERAGLDRKPGNVELAFTTENVDFAADHAVEAGCTLLKAPAVQGHGQTVGWIRDPWGTLIEIATPIG
jgi:predicted enzyme related to lactoylglutathione lyase